MMRNENTSIAGRMMVLEGLLLLFPLLLLPFYPEEWRLTPLFVLPALASVLAGFLICFFKKEGKKPNSSRTVVFIWLYGFALGAAPFYLYGNVTPVQALFESVSGFTTTGLSVLDVSATPRLFLFYRSFLQYVGGLGFVMMMLVFIRGKFSMGLYQAEGHPDKLMPTIGKTAKVIFFMYGFFLALGVFLYALCGMSVFDGLLHTMCALSTGGFSNRMDSIGFYNSVPVEIVTVFLMLVGTTNFSLLLLLFKGKWREFFKASEIRLLGGLTILFVPLITLFMMRDGYTLAHGLRFAFFNAFSAISTTGYATSLYSSWPETATVLLILLMLIGGGIGSTAGGMKLGRVAIAGKELIKNVRRKLRPGRTVLLTSYSRGAEKEILTDDRCEEASTYIWVYLLIFMAGSLALTFFSGSTFLESAFEFASSLGTVGLSIGVTNADTTTICLLIEIAGMVLGRLEIFVLIKALFKTGQV